MRCSRARDVPRRGRRDRLSFGGSLDKRDDKSGKRRDSEAWIHPSANVEPGVHLGKNTKVWDNVHIRGGARIGRSCIVGEKSYLAGEVVVGDFVRIEPAVHVCPQVTIEDFCLVCAQVVFTNEPFPRAGNHDLTDLEPAGLTDEMLEIRVKRGTTLGVNATIGPGLTVGEFAMVGMGSVVTRDVPAHALMMGNPARLVGWVCVCGHPLDRWTGPTPAAVRPLSCPRCYRAWVVGASGPKPA